MPVEPPPCCGRPQVKTDCQAPHCLAYRCPTCGVGCDLNIPDGVCETALRWSETLSDQQAERIRQAIGPDGQAHLASLNVDALILRALDNWYLDLSTAIRSIEDARATLAEVLA